MIEDRNRYQRVTDHNIFPSRTRDRICVTGQELEGRTGRGYWVNAVAISIGTLVVDKALCRVNRIGVAIRPGCRIWVFINLEVCICATSDWLLHASRHSKL